MPRALQLPKGLFFAPPQSEHGTIVTIPSSAARARAFVSASAGRVSGGSSTDGAAAIGASCSRGSRFVG